MWYDQLPLEMREQARRLVLAECLHDGDVPIDFDALLRQYDFEVRRSNWLGGSRVARCRYCGNDRERIGLPRANSR